MHQIPTAFLLALAISVIPIGSLSVADESLETTPDSYEQELSDTDLLAVYALFGVSPNDSEILKIGGSVKVRDGAPSTITAYLATPVAVPDEFTCVIDIKLWFGRKDGPVIDWGRDIVDPLRHAWRFDTPGSCEGRDEETMGRPVAIGLNVPLQVIPIILESEAKIFQAVFHFAAGAPFHHWVDFRMSELSKPLGADDPSKYYARFFKDGEKEGPTIYFSMHGTEVRVESVYNWGQQRFSE